MKRYKKYTTNALESSAIAELFSDSLLLWGRCGPWAALVGSAEGSTKGFHQGSTKVPPSFVVSLVFWADLF